MELILKIIKFEFSNALRSKWIIVYFSFFVLLSFLLFNFEDETDKAVLSLMNVALTIIPLVSIVFGTMYVYNSSDYIQMVLCQPLDRKSLYFGLYLGNAIPLGLSFVVGVFIGFVFNGFNPDGITPVLILTINGFALTLIFTSIAFLNALKFSDKAKGLGASILIWLMLAVIYDGLILFVTYFFRDYPIENIILSISLLNPIDLARIFFILDFNISALMGYTGALFNKFFGTSLGVLASISLMIVWFIIPFLFGLRNFNKKDF
ncbi:MAG: ABC transporter permease subunit [Ignavibacterium sp.]|nr:ABC transporter permease subunit [Ignavibacterium sp.]